MVSGKGGTGKTTVAVNLAYFLSDSGHRVQYTDCDVEEPNGHIFLKPDFFATDQCRVMVPEVNEQRCTSCGECGEKCQFGAIVNIGGKTLVFPEICKGCGLCVRVCPEQAISRGSREIGVIQKGRAHSGIGFVHGVLTVGESNVAPLINAVREAGGGMPVEIVDAPPGTTGPMTRAVSSSDLVVMVTEPTPFGLHDLSLAVAVVRKMDKPAGVVINRAGEEYPPLDEYLQKEQLPVIAVIPEDRDIAEAYSKGNIILRSIPSYRSRFIRIWSGIEKLYNSSGGNSAG